MNLTKEEIIKNEILIQAQDLFKQFGLKKTTMDEIAAACGKAKSTLYHYYKSKEEVFEGVLFMEMTNLRKTVKDYVEEANLVKDKMTRYFIKFHKEVMNKVNIYRLMKQELINDRLIDVYFPRFMEFEKSYLMRILEDGSDAGELFGFNKEEIPFFTEMILAAFFGVVRYAIQTDKGIDVEKLEKTANVLIPRLFS